MHTLKSFFQNHPRADVLIFLLLIGLAVLPYAYSRTAQVTLAWLMQLGYVVIPSSTRREHQLDNLRAADLQLSQDDVAAISALERNERIADPDFAPAWD